MKSIVSFNQLREANLRRLPVFKNKKGEVIHKPDGSDWLLTQWANALQGENGELAELILVAALTKSIGTVGNEAKKLDRADFSMTPELRQKIANELADVATYLDILAYRCGINLGTAVVEKFNAVSERVGVDVWMDYEDFE